MKQLNYKLGFCKIEKKNRQFLETTTKGIFACSSCPYRTDKLEPEENTGKTFAELLIR